MKGAQLDILLATSNGGRFLAEQLDSILAQTFTGWRLIIRDDGSTDGTREIVEHYRARHPDRILMADSGGEKVGAVANFSLLLQESAAEYVMFCDQDDVWLPHKVAATLGKMREAEEQHGRGTPLLVFTDLKVVDERLGKVSDSFWRFQSLAPESAGKLNRLLLQNVTNGCAMMVNAALRKKGGPIPAEAMMHDWWLTLVAAAFGRSVYLTEPTILYRQHGLNTCGAGRWDLLEIAGNFLRSAPRREKTARRRAMMARLQGQGRAFLSRYRGSLPPETQQMLQVFGGIAERGFFARRYYTVKYRFLYCSMIDNIGMLLFR